MKKNQETGKNGGFEIEETDQELKQAAQEITHNIHSLSSVQELADKLQHWSPLRFRLAAFLGNQFFEGFMSVLLLSNLALIVIETDMRASGDLTATLDAVSALGRCLIVVYVLELSARIFVLRWGFLLLNSNILDAVIVALDVCCETLVAVAGSEVPSLQMLRLFRVFRLLRALRFFNAFRELYMMMYGLIGVMKAVCWASLLIGYVLLVFSVIAVEVLNPLNRKLANDGVYQETGCDRCEDAYSSVFMAFMTFVQTIIAGDSWGMYSMPMIEEYPWTAPFIIMVLTTVNFGMLNLIMAVIVDRAETARQEDTEAKLTEKCRKLDAARDTLIKLCSELDKDGSDHLTCNEMIHGYDTNLELRNMLALMDIRKEDISMVFGVLDEDGSGSVSYREFVDQFYRMQTQESHTLLIFIKNHVNEIRKGVRLQLNLLRDEILSKVSEEVRLLQQFSNSIAGPSENTSPQPDPGQVAPASSLELVSAGQANPSPSLEAIEADARFLQAECRYQLAEALRICEEQISTGMRNLQLMKSLVEPSLAGDKHPQRGDVSNIVPPAAGSLVNRPRVETDSPPISGTTAQNGHPRVLRGRGCCDVHSIRSLMEPPQAEEAIK